MPADYKSHYPAKLLEVKCLSESYIDIPLMRLTLLFASLLAVVPVRLICLALNPRIHMNQFVHSLYPPTIQRLRFMNLLLCPMETIFFSRGATSKHMRFASLSGN
jgi:hypothetical protein